MPKRQGGNQLPRHAYQGRIQARPNETIGQIELGLRKLWIDGQSVGRLYIPPSYRPDHTAPLALMLHGAGGNAQQGIGLLFNLATETGLVLVALDSVGPTWDIIQTEYGSDIHRIDQALAQVFALYPVDESHLAIGGFSDGASYALSVGLTNGDLFTHIMAFSPGFVAPAGHLGTPAIFISHGTHDQVLPIDRTSRRIVPNLRGQGYAVEYLEFDGPHTVPPTVIFAALGWFVPTRLELRPSARQAS